MMTDMQKYPRTQHIRGSRFQKGDHDLESVPLSGLEGCRLVIEEKMDGANAGICFLDSKLMLQSRGHFLRGGPRERQFDLFKQWAACHQEALYRALKERYVMYGEWLFAKHTCFYDGLPHYFMEFDLLDRETGLFLSTEARRDHYLREGVDHIIHSVLVIADGTDWTLGGMRGLIRRSNFKTQFWKEALRTSARDVMEDLAWVESHTDMSDDMEGLYIKWEDGDTVRGRYKFVRQTFTNAVLDQGQHWSERTIVPNLLAKGAYARMFDQ